MGVFTRTPFLPYIPSGVIFNSSADDGWSSCRCLAVFPRHKGRTKLISIHCFWQFFVALIISRYVVTLNMFIPELGGWLQLFSLSVFVFLSKGSLKISLSNDCRSGLFLFSVPSHFFLWVITFENIWTLNTWSKVQQECRHFFDLQPHRHLLAIKILSIP
jgi:hypothetical protein